jgi:hypothetical protein
MSASTQTRRAGAMCRPLRKARHGHQSVTSQTAHNHNHNRDRDRDRELVRAITDALVLAAGKRAAHQTLRRARAGSRPTPARAVRAAAHLAGYSALLGYIWHERRTAHHSAA